MTHEPFGTLKYKDSAGSWVGQAPLERFAARGQRRVEEVTDEQAAQMIADMNKALEAMRGQIREQVGEAADAAFRQLEQQIEAEADTPDEPDPAAEDRARKRQARAAKRGEKLARGLFPFRVADPEEQGPTIAQEASFRFLLENEAAVFDAVLSQVWASFQAFYDDEHWRMIMGLKPAATVDDLRGRFGISRVEVALEERGGFAHLVFAIDSEWQDEHGVYVVYSPDRRDVGWTSLDILNDLLPTDETEAGEEEYVATPRDELLEAILTGDDDRARELAVAGADINDLAADDFPPLCIAAEQMEVEDVRRLLAFGADPNLPDPDTGKTPLKLAKKTYRELGFGPAKKNNPLRDAMMILAKETVGGQLDEIKGRLEAIIELLEAAGGK